MSETNPETQPLLGEEEIEATQVYPVIHMIHQDMIRCIDTPLSYEALNAPDPTYTIIRPLEDKYTNMQRRGNYSIVFCLLLNRVYFMRDQHLLSSPLSRSRATLCEILAIRVLRACGDDVLPLAFVTTTSWPVYSGTDERILKQVMQELDVDEVEDHVGNAIEMAIIGRAKRFIKSPACQKVIDSIWSGKCVYQAQSSHSILSDTYKRTPIHFYDPHKAPLLDHYRLKVPAVRSVLEYLNFIIFFVLFVATLEFYELNRINIVEITFMVFALGFSLEKIAAMQEHGLKVFFTGTWNGFDLALIAIYLTYASLRIYGIRTDNPWACSNGIDILALAACIIFPRLAFVTLRNNLMVLSLRAMIIQFVILMMIAVFCFAGFLYALWTLARNEAHYSAGDIFWWMADLWFGLDATGFQLASTFHKYFGPMLMVAYTCLSNTLLVTVLVSILSHTFATISEDAAAEAMYRRAVSTLEGVKADPLFSYQPPINVLALMIMLPASYILTPRWFHKVNVFMIRLTSFPILLIIAYYERRVKEAHATTFTETLTVTAERLLDNLPKQLRRMTFFEGIFMGKGADIDMIFDLEDEIVKIDAAALDYQEPDSKNFTPARPRAWSQADTSRRASVYSTFPVEPPSSPSSSRATSRERADRGSPSKKGIRTRLTSMMQRGAEMASSFTSPLAQIYQPLFVDDDNGLTQTDPQVQGSPSGGLAVGTYGPLSRRRLSSRALVTPAEGRGVALRRFPSGPAASELALVESPVPNLNVNLQDRQDEQLQVESEQTVVERAEKEEKERELKGSSEPSTAAQLMDQEGGSGSLQVLERLAVMEERQKRMEELIIRLSQQLTSHEPRK